MIGNDVVDLQLAKTQSNWLRPRFLDKLFTKNEQEIILNSKKPFDKVWLFWSMKEAAYKCYIQKYPKRFFAPTKFKCELNYQNKGKVCFEKDQFTTETTITNSFLHTIAKFNSVKNYEALCFAVNDIKNASLEIDQKLNQEFEVEIQIKKNAIGVPYVYTNHQKLAISISKSHHGRFASYAIAAVNKPL